MWNAHKFVPKLFDSARLTQKADARIAQQFPIHLRDPAEADILSRKFKPLMGGGMVLVFAGCQCYPNIDVGQPNLFSQAFSAKDLVDFRARHRT